MSRDIFVPIAPEARRDGLAAYAAFLAERDGRPDAARHQLERREAATVRMESERLDAPELADRAAFDRHYERFDPRDPPSRALGALIALAKINASEAYGVGQVFDRAARVGGVELVVLLEEFYHTRILVSPARALGHRVDREFAPEPRLRALIGAISRMPEAASQTITYASEVAGVLTFLRTMRVLDEVFRDQAPVRDALQARVTEVMIDEVGHVSYHRLLRGRLGVAAAERLYPQICARMADSIPELTWLGVFPMPRDEVARFDFSALPAEVRRRAFVA
jgi:hypothetical protein